MRDGDASSRRPADPVFATAWFGNGITISTIQGSFRPEPWTAPVLTGSWALTLARRGAFRRRTDGLEQVVDATAGWVGRPGEEVSTSTFTRTPEDVTIVRLHAPFVHQLRDLSAVAGPITVEPSVAFAHRVLRRRLQQRSDILGLECTVVELVERCVHSAEPHAPRGTRPSTATAHRRLAVDAVEILNLSLGEDLGLVDIASRVGASPAHLSRIFRQVTGVTLCRYRTWLRVNAVLDRLEEGESNLAGLAVDIGFADHGHMTRTITGYLGVAPSNLRTRFVADFDDETVPFAHPRRGSRAGGTRPTLLWSDRRLDPEC